MIVAQPGKRPNGYTNVMEVQPEQHWQFSLRELLVLVAALGGCFAAIRLLDWLWIAAITGGAIGAYALRKPRYGWIVGCILGVACAIPVAKAIPTILGLYLFEVSPPTTDRISLPPR
jgi:hypothetical protein